MKNCFSLFCPTLLDGARARGCRSESRRTKTVRAIIGAKYIFPMLPHGIFPASLFGFMLLHMRLPFNRILCAQASATFYIPYWRQFSRWMGSFPAGKRETKFGLPLS